MRCVLSILLIILCCFLVNGIEECDSPIEPSDVPCAMISTYTFDTPCSSNDFRIYDSKPEEIMNENWQDHGITDRCNATFNFTERDSYLINSSDGSSATIIVRGVKMDFLRLTIFGGFFIISLAFIWLMHTFKEDAGSSIAYGFFALGINAIIASMVFFGFEVIPNNLFTLPFNPNFMLGLISIVLGLYSAWYSTSFLRFKNEEREQFKPSQFEVE